MDHSGPMYDTLVVDDLRSHREGGYHARTSEQALWHLRFSWRRIYLDHDLGPDDDIMPVVDHMCERAHGDNAVMVETVYVHSQNPVGAANVMRALERYGYNVKRIGVDEFTA